jgi:hypothetical protein
MVSVSYVDHTLTRDFRPNEAVIGPLLLEDDCTLAGGYDRQGGVALPGRARNLRSNVQRKLTVRSESIVDGDVESVGTARLMSNSVQ